MKQSLLLVFLFIGQFGLTQTPPATPVDERLSAYAERMEMIENSKLKGITFESVGPSVMSGRVVDLAVNPVDPTHFFVAYASGGLWETRNNGQSFVPHFDSEAVMTIGAIAVQWADTSIWIGTGEVNSSRSSYSGVGMYYSDDKGTSWQHRGLGDSHHIGRVIIAPEDPKTIWVASLGPLYTSGGQRGIFKSSDGGMSWEHSLDTGVGAVDLVMHPSDPSTLYAALWDRHRTAWNFRGSGPGSGIYVTTDGGLFWEDMSQADSGFPMGEGRGRIGLDITTEGGKTILYAMHDNQSRRPVDTDSEETSELKASDFKDMRGADFLALDSVKVKAFLTESKFPSKHDYRNLRSQIEEGTLSPVAIYEFLTDANAALFDTPVIGAEVYRYDFTQQQWAKTHTGYLDDLVYSYGYYFGLIRVRPGHADEVYIAGVPLLYSVDGGANFQSINPSNVHADHHALWINPDKPGHLINGNDGGINISYDNGAHFVNCNSPAVGQFYTVAVDDNEPYNIYGGLQDNGVWRGPSSYQASDNWLQTGDYPYKSLLGGDGMQIAIDPSNNETVYTGYQFGHYYRIEEGKAAHYFHPSHTLGERPLRWNWQTPIHMSMHNPDVLYMGSNKVHRSMNRGETWEAISPDLSNGGKAGNVPYGTITSISESPLEFGRLIAGTDDGRLWISDGGFDDWREVPNDPDFALPSGYWVSRVIASEYDKARYYISFNGYRQDDMTSMMYRTDDNGDTWQQLAQKNKFPSEPINVILEDPSHEDILYVGTDHGLYASLDGGERFEAMMTGLPHVAVHDMVIQARAQDLIVGTHGRSIYKADVGALYQMMASAKDVILMDIDSLSGSETWGEAEWSQWFGTNTPTLNIAWYTASLEQCTLEICDAEQQNYVSLKLEPGLGIQAQNFDLRLSKAEAKRISKLREETLKAATDGHTYLPVGTYTLDLNCPSGKDSNRLIISK